MLVRGIMLGMVVNSNNLLDGVTLEVMVTELAAHLGWEAMASAIPVRCFAIDPSVKSSLKFLRRTPWARSRVEALYLRWRQGRSAGAGDAR